MKLVKSLLLGTAAGLVSVVAAQAADLPTRKAAPVQYVRICDAYGAGFFFIPGTDTCLKIGGFVLADLRIQPDSARNYRVNIPTGTAVAALGASGLAGAFPATTGYVSNNARELYVFDVTGRIELDARTQSPFGTVRSFVRLDANYGSSANGQTGSLQTSLGNNAFNSTAGATVARELVYLNKGFIQFAGITAGRVQSFFDFYADAINYAGLYGSNATVWGAAYTWTGPGGWSVTGSIEDPTSRRAVILNVINTASVSGIAALGAFGATGNVAASIGRAVMPEIVGNVRWDQPWGAVQVSGALHNIQGHLYPATALTSGTTGNPTTYAEPVNTVSKLGFAVQGGVQFNLDMLAPGDKLWLQATYARGAIGYVQGNTLAFTGGLNGSTQYGSAITRSTNAVGWTGSPDGDCAFNYTGGCDTSRAFSVLAALKHYWTPTISSGFFGNYYQVTYGQASQYPINPIVAAGGGAGAGSLFTVGLTNFRQVRLGTNLVWTPIKNFDIGAEVTYARYMTTRPFGLAPDFLLRTIGLPAFQGTTNQLLGQIRMIRAF